MEERLGEMKKGRREREDEKGSSSPQLELKHKKIWFFQAYKNALLKCHVVNRM